MHTHIEGTLSSIIKHITDNSTENIDAITIINEEVVTSNDIKLFIDTINKVKKIDKLCISKINLSFRESHELFGQLSEIKNINQLQIKVNSGNYVFSYTTDHYWLLFYLSSDFNNNNFKKIIFIGDSAPKEEHPSLGPKMGLTLEKLSKHIANLFVDENIGFKLFIEYPIPLIMFENIVEKFQEERIDNDSILSSTDINGTNINHALNAAAKAGSVVAIKYFIEKGADVNSSMEFLLRKKSLDITPIGSAFIRAQFDVVAELISCGAELTCNERYNSIFYLLFRLFDVNPFGKRYSSDDGNRIKIIKYLIDMRKLNINDPIIYGSQKTMLHMAVNNKWSDVMISGLIKLGADVNFKDNFGNTPLYDAVYLLTTTFEYKEEILKIIKLLVNAGADINIKNNDNVSALDMLPDIDPPAAAAATTSTSRLGL